MGWNGNDIQYLSTIDRVKRLERSTLKPNESGDYDETSPNLTERVEALEAYVYAPVYKNGDTLPTPELGEIHTYHIISDGTVLSGSPTITIDGEPVFDATSKGTTLLVTNSGGVISLYNLDGVYGSVGVNNLTVLATHLALKRVVT